MLRSVLLTLLCAGCLGACCRVTADDTSAAPASKEAWIERLSTLRPGDRETYTQFSEVVHKDPELTYAIFRDGIPRIRNANVRALMFKSLVQTTTLFNGDEEFAYAPNTHLLDIMSAVLAGPAMTGDGVVDRGLPVDKRLVLEEARGMAFREFADREAFERWRAEIGSRPVIEILRSSAERVVNELNTGDDAARLKTLETLDTIRYYTGTGVSMNNGTISRSHSSAGLMRVRHDILLHAGFLDALAQRIRPNNSEKVRREATIVLARFGPVDSEVAPFDKDLKRELPPLMALEQEREKVDRNPEMSQALKDLLTALSSDWAVDLIVKLLGETPANQQPDFTLVAAVQFADNPRMIPALIALLDSPRGMDPAIGFESTLVRLTRIPADVWGHTSRPHDGLWWRAWWHENRVRYPLEVQRTPIPKLAFARSDSNTAIAAADFRPRLARARVSEDPLRSYWIVSATSGAKSAEPPVGRASQSGRENPLDFRASLPKPEGLIVVLMDGDRNDASVLDSWMDASDALRGDFLIAVAARPDWSRYTAAPPSRASQPATHADLSDPARFAEQIARQMLLDYRIDPARTYLCAVGPAGIAGYQCALQRETPFRGFLMLSAPIRTALLPTLATAKDRRFFLGLGLLGYGSSDALAAAAEPILRRQGATVHTNHPADGVEAVSRAIRWLEGAPK